MKKSGSWILVVLGLALIIGAAAVVTQTLYVGAGDEYEPEYPFPVQDMIYSPVWGQINCQKTGGVTAITQPTPYECDLPGWLRSGACYDFTCEYIGGCKIRSITGTCGWTESFSKTVNNEVNILPLNVDYGQSVTIRTWCTGIGYCKPPKTVDVDIVGYQAKLYVYAHGYAKVGYLSGSDNCKLVSVDAATLSVDAATLKEMQDKSADELKGVEQIPMGVTKHIIVGWREDPAFGTVNPCGKYNGQDVVCRPYEKIASLKKIYTEGNRNYWTVDEVIETYTQNNQLCCCAGDCAAGYECEAYHCVEKPVICEHGQCPWGVEQCSHVSGCFHEGNKFYLRNAYCDADKCCQYTEREVMCCRDFCDAMSTPTQSFYCDYDKGCEEVIFEKQCPAGCCCLSGGEYKIQNCLPGKECCMELANPYMGLCKDSCSGITPIPPPDPDEGCYKECVETKECGWGITIPGGVCRLQCKIMCWFYDHIWYFVLGSVGLVLFLIWKVFKRASPHMQVAKAAYRTMRKK